MEAPKSHKNLTCLSHSIQVQDSLFAHEEVTEELQLVNALAKPGNGYELTIGEGGYVRWKHYDAEPMDVPVEVRFSPDRRSLVVEVPDWLTVEVRKVSHI